MAEPKEPKPVPHLRDLPTDPRGFLVPAETPWVDGSPRLSKVEPVLKLLLAAHRACSVCGYPMPPDEAVWRIFDDVTRKTTHEQILEDRVIDLDTPGHLVCMLYSALVCPYWRTAKARLSSGSMFTPGQARGPVAAIMGFADFAILIDPQQPVGGGEASQNLFTMLRSYDTEVVLTTRSRS